MTHNVFGQSLIQLPQPSKIKALFMQGFSFLSAPFYYIIIAAPIVAFYLCVAFTDSVPLTVENAKNAT